MLKMYANGEKDGKPIRLVIFGLSHKNLDKLREGLPIKFNGESAGLASDVEIVIFAGESEQAMQREFRDMIGPETDVHIDPRLRD
jgi:hypothetical protein